VIAMTMIFRTNSICALDMFFQTSAGADREPGALHQCSGAVRPSLLHTKRGVLRRSKMRSRDDNSNTVKHLKSASLDSSTLHIAQVRPFFTRIVVGAITMASQCPFHQQAQQVQQPEHENAGEEGKCPFRREQAPAEGESSKCPMGHGAVAEDGEMCSHGRKKLEKERLAAEEAQSADGRPRHLPQQDWKSATGSELKGHFTLAYNMVAEDVSRRNKANSAKIAQVLIRRLGYTEGDMKVVGDDTWVMQGTGNPHALARIQAGEKVVDFGSGFGIDAFIAASRVGPTGRVTGIDLSLGEVTAAIKRASERRLRNVDFRLGDMEDVPFEDATTDVVISNGGFCLVPDKAQSFREIFRILRPGGRFTISCTTLRRKLDERYDWPSCFVVFMPLDSVTKMLTDIGFTDIIIDDTNARMDLWDEVKEDMRKEDPQEVAKAESGEKKTTIHTGNPKFDFLKQLNMNDYCARVNIRAVKPE
jgi:arsenite methyltransferase